MGFTNKDSHRHGADYEADMYTGITTFHGLVRIYNARSWASRVFWVAVVLTAFGVFSFQAFTLLGAYHRRPTSYESNIRVPSDGLAFPAVTLCSFSPVRRSLVETLYGDLLEAEDSQSLFQYLLMSYMSLENFLHLSGIQSSAQAIESELKGLQKSLANYNQTRRNGTFSYTQFFNDTGFQCRDLFKFCSFGGIEFDCCHYAQPIMTDVGKCWKFNRFGPEAWMQRQFVSGQSYGLEVLVDGMTEEYPMGDLPTSEKGIRYYVHRDEEVPQMSSKSIGVSPGRIAYGPIRYTSWSLLEKSDWGVCQRNWTAADIPDALKIYTLANCELNCLANYFRTHCACVPIKYHIHQRHPVCSPHEIVECFHRLSNVSAHTVHLDDGLSPRGGVSVNRTYWYQCSGVECGVECDRRAYQSTLSYAELEPSLSYLPQYSYANATYARNNYVLLKIFYEDIFLEEHVQKRALDATTILSNIGGNTGMFLGMSVITLAEILVFFLKWAWGRVDADRRDQLHRKLEKERGEHKEALP